MPVLDNFRVGQELFDTRERGIKLGEWRPDVVEWQCNKLGEDTIGFSFFYSSLAVHGVQHSSQALYAEVFEAQRARRAL